MRFRTFLLIILTNAVFLSTGFCQSAVIEATKQKIYRAETDKERLASLVALGRLRNSLHGDTINYYAQWAKKLALQLKDNRNLAWAEYSLISGDLAKGKTDSVIQKIEHNNIFKDIKNTDAALYYKIQLLKANALNRANNRTAALDLQLKILNEAEKDGNLNARLFVLNFIGATYLNVNKAADAKHSWQTALKIIQENPAIENNEIEAYILSNLALYYFNIYQLNKTNQGSDSFFTTIHKAIDLSGQNENLGVLASSLSLRGNFYSMLGQFTAAEKDIKDGLAVRKKIGDPLYIANDFLGLCNFYFSQQQYDRCIEAAREGLAITYSGGIRGAEQLQLIAATGYANKAKGDYQQYSKSLEQYIAAADTSNRENAAEKIADIQTRYEVQKKETIIAQQKLDLFQRKLLLYGGIIFTLLLLGFLTYRFKQLKKQHQKKLAESIEEEKRQQEQAVRNAEENERRRIAAELHDNLGVQANAILHSSTLLQVEVTNKNVVADLQETAKEMLHNLRETLWAMKAADVSATDLWLRVINFMKQMGRHYTSIHFKIEGLAPENYTIAASQALHIILVIQESVNNSVKHAEATTITAKSLQAQGEWQITIGDNGKGFDLMPANRKDEGYGLENMKQRAAAGNFEYRIETAPGKGFVSTIYIRNA